MDNQISTFGIIGNPLKHSLSPIMHNTAFAELGVEAVYELFPLGENELAAFFEEMHDKDSFIFGLNVTVPYKERVIQFMDNLSPFAEKAMSVNTIVVTDTRKLIGHNTDGPGFLSHLMELGINTEGKRIAILGAGGTTRAILGALCLLPERPESIRIYNRTTSKADQLVADLSQRINVDIVRSVPSMDDLNIELADMLINTTSVGLSETDECIVDENLLHANMLVYDVIYNPRETKLLAAAKAKEAQTANGLGMLFYQGILSFQHWANMELESSIKDKIRVKLEEAIPS